MISVVGVLVLLLAIATPILYDLHSWTINDSAPDSPCLKSLPIDGCSNGQLHSGTIYYACPTGFVAVENDNITHLKFKPGFEFKPSGLGLVTVGSNLLIAAVNLKQSGPTIERFVLANGLLEHTGSFSDPALLPFPIDVVPTGPVGFYATNFLASSGWMSYFELFMRRPFSWVVYRDETGKARKILKGLVTPTGIFQNHDKFWIVESTRRTIKQYQQRENGGLRLLDTIDLGFIGHAIHIENQGAVVVAGHTNAIDLISHFKSHDHHSPSIAVKIVNNTAGDQFYGKRFKVETIFADSGKRLSAASSAITIGKNVYVSGLFSSSIWKCKAK